MATDDGAPTGAPAHEWGSTEIPLLDDTIGVGAQHALRHRGGSVFRVLESGAIRVGDEVQPA